MCDCPYGGITCTRGTCASAGDSIGAALAEALAACADLPGTKGFGHYIQGLLAELGRGRGGSRRTYPNRRSAGARGIETGEHGPTRCSPHPRRNSVEARSGEHGAGRGSVPAPPSLSRNSKRRGVSSCARRFHWRSFISRPNASADAHAVLAPALEGFSPTPEFPEIEEAQRMLAALTHDDRVSETVAKQHAHAKLHVDYARAVQWGMGFAADETKSAFARADALAVAAPGDPEYWALMYGRFANFLMRGEFVAAHEAAASYLRQAQVAGRLDHVVNAAGCLARSNSSSARSGSSREEFEALLANWDEDRDRALRAVTGADVLCVGWAYMAQTLVCLGEVEAALRMSEDAIRRAEASDDFGARAFALTNRLQIDAIRGRPDAMREPAEALRKVVSEKSTPLWELNAKGYAIWARGPLQPDPAAGANELGEIIAAKLERKELMRIYHWYGLVAELQSASGACEDALVSVAKGLEIAAQTGGHCKDSYLYRVRGDVLAKRNSNAAEAAYREALRVAGEQDARTFGLQAAHALGKFYRSMNRATDAHAVLTPVLEGFSPTSEFPEIEEAQKLLDALVGTDEVKNAAASRQRRLKLQTSYGQALFWSKGFGAEETKAAFIRAQELAAGIGDTAERFPTYYGLWIGGLARGELAFARQTAKTFLHDAKREGRSTEIAVATRNLGFTYLCQGEFSNAEENLEEALRIYDPKHDRDATVHFAQDHVAASTVFLAQTKWVLGEVDRARTMINKAVAISVEAAHAPTAANVLQMKALFELLRNDTEAVTHAAEAAIELSQKHGLSLSLVMGELYAAWVHARLDDGESGAKAFRGALRAYADQGNRLFIPIYQASLAEIEADRQGGEAALALLDETLALAEQTGEHWTDAFLHRVRGEVLLKRDPANAALAEQAFLTAIAVAQQQKAKSFELRAALSLAKLYQSANRPADAHAVLAPALEGFAPTPEFPEITEAQALLDTLAKDDRVREALGKQQQM